MLNLNAHCESPEYTSCLNSAYLQSESSQQKTYNWFSFGVEVRMSKELKAPHEAV
ncbi:hypothetical protein GCM10007853_03350 [Algimonas ampicilliniresistens]|uniref:Uncharacterized protein n=1 Tax=Algimonas ampicilliniresistens TaxID=1298735 RepID=A0ABQ5V7A3_9PROT|nr:hypothetical protein GCM10007853_03350 [Algimonas ampicilliniresistens]